MIVVQLKAVVGAMDDLKSRATAILWIVVIVGGIGFHIWRICGTDLTCVKRGGDLVRSAFDAICGESR